MNPKKLQKIIELCYDVEETELVDLLDIRSEQLVERFLDIINDRQVELEKYFEHNGDL